MVTNPTTEALHIQVVDSAASGGGGRKWASVLGSLSIRISDLMKRPGWQYARPQPFSFTDGNSGNITLSMELKALKKAEAFHPRASVKGKSSKAEASECSPTNGWYALAVFESKPTAPRHAPNVLNISSRKLIIIIN